jgi:hypothetical protein
MLLGVEDARRAVEAAHDVAASEDVAGLTPRVQEQEAVAFSRAELAGARELFMNAAAHSAQELRETDVARVEIAGKRETLAAHYARAAHSAGGLLVDEDPDAPMSDAERERRERLIKATFNLTRNELRDLAPDTLHARLTAWQSACEQNADLKPLKLCRAIKPHIAQLGALVADHRREVREDREATAALNAAREGLDVAHRAHVLLLESVLVRGGRSGELGRFVLARDAAYIARRAANKPITEEPGAPALLDLLTPAADPV